MNTMSVTLALRGIVALALCAGVESGNAHADERGERARQEPNRSPKVVHHGRDQHRLHYPMVGHAVEAIPRGHVRVNFGDRRLAFHHGVWYEPRARGFAVVRPPVGAIVPVLPPVYSTVWIAGMPHYHANDAYYVAAPGGYAVASSPAEVTYIEAPTALPPAPQPQMAPTTAAVQPDTQATGATWYYCESATAYYPYVATCAEGWKLVPATPPPPGR